MSYYVFIINGIVIKVLFFACGRRASSLLPAFDRLKVICGCLNHGTIVTMLI